MGDLVLTRIALASVALVVALEAAGHAEPAGRVVGTIAVTDAEGAPIAGPIDAIVYVVGFTEPPGATVTTVKQTGRKFIPDLVAITVGERVTFPNGDAFFHNVFSQSSARKFDLGSFKKGEAKHKEFPLLGVVDVYCNIHPEMAATILVLPNHRHTRTKPDGSYVIDGVRPGTWKVFAYTRRATRPTASAVIVQASIDAKIDLVVVRGADTAHVNKFGEQYRDPKTYR